MVISILIGLLKVNLTGRIDDQDLSVLSNHSLSRASGANWGRPSWGCLCRLDLLNLVFFGFLFLLASLLAINRLRDGLAVFTSCRCGGTAATSHIHARYAQVISPRRMARKLDISLNELLLPVPAHVEGKPVSSASDEDKQPGQNCAQAWTEARVVVSRSLPGREAVGQKVIISIATLAAQDGRHQAQARKAVAGFFGCSFDLSLGWALGDVHAGLLAILRFVLRRGLVSNELLLDLVGVQQLRFLAVGLVDVVLVRIARDAYKVVEGDAFALGGLDLGAQAEDLLV